MMNNHGQNSDQVYVKREKAARRASKEDQVIDGGGLSEVPAGTDHGDDEKPSLPHTQQVCLMIVDLFAMKCHLILGRLYMIEF